MFNIFPYFTSIILLVCAYGTMYLRNPVHALLSLVAMVVNMSFLFISAKSEFVGLLLIIVYAGAVAVLFLFVIMMVNYKESLNAKRTFSEGYPMTFIMSILLVFSVIRTLFKYMDSLKEEAAQYRDSVEFSNLKNIGDLMYNSFANEIILTGVILFIGVVGSIVITIRYIKIVPKRISVSQQVGRDKKTSIQLVKPKLNRGVDY